MFVFNCTCGELVSHKLTVDENTEYEKDDKIVRYFFEDDPFQCTGCNKEITVDIDCLWIRLPKQNDQ